MPGVKAKCWNTFSLNHLLDDKNMKQDNSQLTVYKIIIYIGRVISFTCI